MYIVIQHFFSQLPWSESVLITSYEPYISYSVVKSFLESLLLIVISGNLRQPMIFVILLLIVVIAQLALEVRPKALRCLVEPIYNQCSPQFLSGLVGCSHASLKIPAFIFFQSTTVKSVPPSAQLMQVVVYLICP